MCWVEGDVYSIAGCVLYVIPCDGHVLPIDDPDCGLLALGLVIVGGDRIVQYPDVVRTIFDVHAFIPGHTVIVRDLDVVSAGDAHAEPGHDVRVGVFRNPELVVSDRDTGRPHVRELDAAAIDGHRIVQFYGVRPDI